MAELKRNDIKRWTENDRTITAAVFLQLHCGIDPDHSRTLADSLVRQIDRVAMRGHRDAAPTADEIRRAQNALNRRGYPVDAEHVREALDASFIRGWSL
jgi:hypothetical protein